MLTKKQIELLRHLIGEYVDKYSKYELNNNSSKSEVLEQEAQEAENLMNMYIDTLEKENDS